MGRPKLGVNRKEQKISCLCFICGIEFLTRKYPDGRSINRPKSCSKSCSGKISQRITRSGVRKSDRIPKLATCAVCNKIYKLKTKIYPSVMRSTKRCCSLRCVGILGYSMRYKKEVVRNIENISGFEVGQMVQFTLKGFNGYDDRILVTKVAAIKGSTVLVEFTTPLGVEYRKIPAHRLRLVDEK